MTTVSLNRRSPIPLYYQLAEWLREQISAGNLPVGSQLPSERDLGDQVGISRMTARQAITYLVNEGVLVVRQGVGTFVAEPKLTHNALNLLGFTAEMMAQGGQVTSDVLEQALVSPPQRVAERLALRPDAQTVKVVRLRFVDGQPLLLETSYVPSALCPGLESEDLAGQSLYTLLEERYGLRLQRASQTFEATVLNEYERTHFSTSASLSMVLLQGVTFAGHDQPVEYFKALYRGDRFQFSLESARSDGIHASAPPTVSIVMK